MEFKVGDTVKILDRVGDETDYSPIYSDGMLKYAGTLTSIKEITGYGSLILYNNTYYWDKKAVKLVNKDKYLHPSELKDGDFIKIQSNTCSFIYIFEEYENGNIYRHASFDLRNSKINIDPFISWNAFKSSDKITYATKEERKILLNALLKESYIWDNVSKKLIEVSSANLIKETSIDTVEIPQEYLISDCIGTNIAVHSHWKNYNTFCDGTEEKPKEELNLFPTKKHYQLNFNY